jgi:signal transduction histidine kinase
VTLDLYIVGRLVWHRVHSRARPWSTVYSLLLTTAVFWALTDFAELMEYAGVWTLGTGTITDLAWFPAWLSLVAAARAPQAVPAASAPRTTGTGSLAAAPWAGSLLFFAVAVPGVHIGLSTLGVLDPASRPARDLCALVLMVVLTGLATAHQRLLHRENARLVADRDAVTRRLQGAQRVEAIGRLAGGIAHDFNNLLTVILTNAGLMETSLRSGQTDVREDLEELTAAARRGTSLVKKLLGVGRRDLLVFRPVDVAEVVRGFYPSLRRIVRPSIEMRFDADAGLPPGRADAGAVEQILMNLVANASDAMPQGGVLVIEVRRANPNRASGGDGGTAATPELLALTVTDTGIGMDERTKDQLFEPFFTTKQTGEGTGLGLAMVYGLAKQHGGTVEVVSAPDRGTTVRVLLPVWRDEIPAAAAAPADPDDQRAPAILVVEDEAPIRRAAQRSLERLGYRVLVAEDGESALRLFEVHAGEIHVVVSDVLMPRLSGIKLHQAVQRLRPGTRFIFTSGYAAADLPPEHGMDPRVPFLSKPWTLEELAAKVREVIGTQ